MAKIHGDMLTGTLAYCHVKLLVDAETMKNTHSKSRTIPSATATSFLCLCHQRSFQFCP